MHNRLIKAAQSKGGPMHTIFSIDNVNDTATLMRFLRRMDTLQAMGRLGSYVMCHGSYKGELELSFIMDSGEFEEHVRYEGFVGNQESFLEVDGNRWSTLIFTSGYKVVLGQMESVSKEHALKQEAWTYRPDLNKYFCVV